MTTISVKQIMMGSLWAMSVAAGAAHADCLRAGHTGDVVDRADREPRAEAAVSMTDPAMDGLFARYADLHRDAVGYAMADLPGSSMVARAGATEARTPITR